MKSKTFIVTTLVIIITLVIVTVVYYTIQSNKENQKISQPVTPQITFCKPINGYDCINCQCNTAADCHLVSAHSCGSGPQIVNKSTTDECFNRPSNVNINCVPVKNFVPPTYEIVCVNNTCGKIIK